MRNFFTIIFIFLIFKESLGQVFGVSPEASQYYVKGKRFKCLDGSKEISFTEVNDDFCDCKDGSDEPGTSACSSGNFFCLNKGHESAHIPHAYVGDGVCDCCDGSDEPSGKCKNDCEEKGRIAKQAALEKEKVLKAGVLLKETLSKNGQLAIQTSKETLEKLQVSYKEMEQKVEKLKKMKEIEEEKKRVSEEIRKKESGEYAKEQCETFSSFIKLVQKEMEELEKLLTEKSDVQDIVDKIASLKESIPSNLDCNPPTTAAETEDSEFYEQEIEDEEEVYEEGEDDENESRGDSLSDKLRDYENKLSKLKTNIEKQEKIQNLDFGKSKEFFNLFGECFSFVSNEYKYELCPYNKVTQSNKNGGSSTDLGKWENWDGYSAMKYTHGQGCWQGPQRSTLVKLECGTTSEILSVEEPAKCEYLMKFKTPAACNLEDNPTKKHEHHEL